MFLAIEPSSDIPIYLQLRNQIVDALVRGELVEGDRLPSVRRLAVDLGINLHTVNKAYKVLEDEGYLGVYGRKGVRVVAPPTYTTSYLVQLEATLARLFIEARSQGIGEELFQASVNNAIAASRVFAPSGTAAASTAFALTATPASTIPAASPVPAVETHAPTVSPDLGQKG
ncbi:MAG: GntR family transcriptional regulator [Coriobacteriales bacterium]|jgi:DNA-binding transcriptional regulator YhcF (GntR family)|nr:GntR family transcriptional regulator [Coriobacteriales bacterium]